MTRLFPPDERAHALAAVMAGITGRRDLNQRRDRSYPRVIKRRGHNFYRIKKPGDHGTRHHAPPTIRITNPQVAA